MPSSRARAVPRPEARTLSVTRASGRSTISRRCCPGSRDTRPRRVRRARSGKTVTASRVEVSSGMGTTRTGLDPAVRLGLAPGRALTPGRFHPYPPARLLRLLFAALQLALDVPVDRIGAEGTVGRVACRELLLVDGAGAVVQQDVGDAGRVLDGAERE